MCRTIQILLHLVLILASCFQNNSSISVFILISLAKCLSILLIFPKNQKKRLWSRREPNPQRRAQAFPALLELHTELANRPQPRSASCQPVCRYRSENRWWLFPVIEFWRWFIKQLWLADTVNRYYTSFNQFLTDGDLAKWTILNKAWLIFRKHFYKTYL